MQELQYENLLGREWTPRNNCYALGRDFFKQNFDIETPDIAMPINWDANKLDLLRLGFPKTGFKLVNDEWEDLRPGDVLCMAIATSNANHIAIYVGDNNIIHHRYGTNSCEEVLRPYWRMSTLYILRHPDVPDLRPQLPTVELEELIRARFTRETD